MAPIVSKRTLFFCIVDNSSLMVFTKSIIKASTSAFGRFQFSVEKAYKVKYLTPNSPQPSITSVTAFKAFLCPKTLSTKPCCFAQRPFPSIITAMCFGRLFWSNCSFTDLTQFNRMVFYGMSFRLLHTNIILFRSKNC